MLRFSTRLVPVLAGLLCCSSLASAGDYYVPTEDYPTLDVAVLAAAGSADAVNTIYIRESPIYVTATISLDSDFNCGHTLVIRPDPGIPTLRRATIASMGFSYIFNLIGSACVTFQDLDIVRHITNAWDLVQLTGGSDILFQRCRIGIDHLSPGAPGHAYMIIQYPTDIVIRNCIFFSAVPGDMDYGIVASNFADDTNSLYLYNNVVADYELRGVQITGAAVPGPLLAVRNNVVANHPSLAVEPVAFWSDVNSNMIMLASHNAIFGTAGFREAVIGVQSVSGFPTGTLVSLATAALAASFVDIVWDVLPEFTPNPDFYRLLDGGPLHTAPPGVDVLDDIPVPRDIAVRDDWEKDPRPGGVVPHTDRGADQIEAGLAVAVADLRGPGAVLFASPARNPTRGALGLEVRCGKAGLLELELFDVAGRMIYRTSRAVESGWQGGFEGPGPTSGQFFYRLRLAARDGTTAETRGRITLIR
jgi:hypothetical protein